MITRRAALAGLGGVGVGAALNSSGTMAFLSDTESSTDNMMTAGTLDLKLDWDYWYHGKKTNRHHQEAANNPGPMIEFGDVKPGDWACGVISVDLDGNPAHLWAKTSRPVQDENGQNEPEEKAESDVEGAAHGDHAGDGDLGEHARAALIPMGCYEEPRDTQDLLDEHDIDPDTRPSMADFDYRYYLDGVIAGSMHEVLHDLRRGEYLGGHENGTCYYGFCWWIPTSVGNEIQSDSIAFDMQFYAEQLRHNETPQSPFITSNTEDGFPNFVSGDHWTVQARAGEAGNDDDVYGFANGRLGFSRVDKTWQGNTDYDFELTYDGESTATFSIDGATITSTEIPGARGNLALVAKDYGEGYDIVVDDVAVGGSIDGPNGVTAGNGGTRHLGIHGMHLEDGFTLTGTLRFDGISGQIPTGSGAGLQILVQQSRGPTTPPDEDDDVPALEPGDISSFGVIEEPGTYTLTTDLDATEAGVTTGFEIKADDVTLDGNGFTITGGPETAEGVHIIGSSSGGGGGGGGGSPLNNVTVTDMTITGWDSGISAMNLRNGEFSDLRFVSNIDKGIGVLGSRSENNLITGCYFEDNLKGVFLLQGVSETTIDDNEFVENHEVAVKAAGASDTTLTNNTFDGQDGEKTIHFTGRSPGNLVEGNLVENSDGPEYAIHVGGESGDTVIRNNTVQNNTLGGITIGPSNIQVENNTVTGNGGVGLSISGTNVTAAGNTITDNAVGAQFDGRLATNNTLAAGNVVKNNDWDLSSIDEATGNTVERTVVTDTDTEVRVEPSSADYDLRGLTSVPPVPSGYTDLGKYAEVADPDSELASELTAGIYYGSLPSGVSAGDLTMLRYDGSAWVEMSSATVDETNGYVQATLAAAEFGQLAVVAE